ncbi:type II secretion system F family protein [Paraburkholderia megapolitana]|uniref:Tight adherence protein C n=1 Tax=Paraburkholderia megapolitana TaxID=420953 RepID=A0A1I3RA68_9BURK|nr:type II secretion system F family protein [Paraburkholderia megapolitana]QDQ83729.1 type II secretion system F family protein [Paraburkholderia megapolitana]SFJ42076.1 tight adherence protein C [Paraburkholderia megapolitana]
MESNHLLSFALAAAALGLLLIASLLIARLVAAGRSERTLAHALDERALQNAAAVAATATRAVPSIQGGISGASGAAKKAPAVAPARGIKGMLESFSHTGARWLDTPFGRQIVAEEDRRLLEQCGFVDTRTRGLFLIARILCAIVFPVIDGIGLHGHVDGTRYVVFLLVSAASGVMVPKIMLRRRAAARRRAIADELPLLVDLLRLLQGVGLSLDQSLQVIVGDFRGVLPVLSSELEIAQRQFATGRTREQSLNRLSSSYENEDLRAVVRLLIQVDRHGGAVQEPLKQFGDRLRETRRSMLRERIGRLTVKMTGVMILTLLPALMIVTAGPGVLSVTHSLKSMHH